MRGLIYILCLIRCLWGVSMLDEGDTCTDDNGETGICKYITQCDGAIQSVRKGSRPKMCKFEDIPIICCVKKIQRSSYFSLQATKRPTTTTTEYTPTEADYEDNRELNDVCRPIRNFTAKVTDRIAWKKCLEYQEEFVYPCKQDPLGNKARENNCKHNANQLVVGGVNAGEAEFPHMVMLSYGKDIESFKAECGGSLISDWFILTAAHCTYKRDIGEVQYAATSALKQSNIDKSRIYKIARRLQHDKYIANYHYYDIALLKTETRITLDLFTVPACLDLGDDLNDSQALAVGWGAITEGGDPIDHLQKVVLNKFPDAECISAFKQDRKLPDDLKPDIQMCYGDREVAKDACRGDSGGPLQLKMQRVKCMYSIIGISSFGRGCGTIGLPGAFTRVAPFVSWIEELVWPNEN